jgi:hypothetical protein
MALFEHRVSPNPGIPSNIPIIKPLYHKKYILKQFKTDTLWCTNIAMENHNFSWENPLFLWPFSIAMLVHQRVSFMYHYSVPGRSGGF